MSGEVIRLYICPEPGKDDPGEFEAVCFAENDCDRPTCEGCANIDSEGKLKMYVLKLLILLKKKM